MRKIIGLSGLKGAGKDTCAAFLIEQLGFERVAFADKLYREAAEAFGVTVEFLGNRETKESNLAQLSLQNCSDPRFVQCVAEVLKLDQSSGQSDYLQLPLSPRVVMQLWGTEFRRKKGIDSYWLDIVHKVIMASPEKSFVITDVRFLNEVKFVKQIGGINVRLRRPALEAAEALQRAKNGTAAHSSETELLNVVSDAELVNEEGNPASLREGILAVAQGETAAV